MSRFARSGRGMTPVEDAPYIKVKETSSASSSSSVSEKNKSSVKLNALQRTDSIEMIAPIITSPTLIPKKRTNDVGKSKKCKYVLIAFGVLVAIIIIVVLACIPLYIKNNKPSKDNL